VEDHFETLEQVYEDRFSRQYGFWRNYVRQVIYRYLDCGILHNGFARVRCGDCGHEFLLAFSCKRRHPCLRWGKLLPLLSSKAGEGVWGMALRRGDQGRAAPPLDIQPAQNAAQVFSWSLSRT
jgi:ribosomal protein S27E